MHWSAIFLPLPQDLHQPVDGDLLLHLLLEQVAGATFMGERVHRNLPSLVLAADHEGAWHENRIEERFIELCAAGELPERTDGDAGRLHVDDEVRDAPMFRDARIGARQANRPAREFRITGPHLLPREAIAVAIFLRLGA